MTNKQLAQIKDVLIWLHAHRTTYETLVEDFEGDSYMGYENRNAADVSDALHQCLESAQIKYRGDQVLKALKYEMEHPELAEEIGEYLRNNRIEEIFP